ncbi:hypothetical protein [Natrinema sp. DC36]|uniref:hypothetical protein n=1 Tax=Natrinema sp. DC36 TaxID=2878680 RepID=UPI001CF0AA99|nr:hypothetical protein [Natrinema sp. DC36]
MSESETELEPCRHCGTETTQRAEGIPYCSMDCIGARRRELEQETIECPYPDCDWSTNYSPDKGLSRAIAYHKAEQHREEHRSQLAEANPTGGNQ